MSEDIVSIIDRAVMGNAGCGIKEHYFVQHSLVFLQKMKTSFQLGRQIRQSHLYYYFQRM